ncbi:MAG: TolC family protein, partial [Ferruginibacter sp.]
MKKLRNYRLVMLSLLTINLHVNAQKTNSFTVKQAVEYANKNSVQVKNALLDILIQKQTNRDITSIALPQIGGTGSVTDYLQIPTTLLPGEIAGQPAGTYKAVKFGTKWTAGA